MPTVLEVLHDWPEKMTRLETAVARAREKYDLCKIHLTVCEASAIGKNANAKNQMILKSIILQDPGVQQAMKDKAEARKELDIATAYYNEAHNAWESAKKLYNGGDTTSEIKEFIPEA